MTRMTEVLNNYRASYITSYRIRSDITLETINYINEILTMRISWEKRARALKEVMYDAIRHKNKAVLRYANNALDMVYSKNKYFKKIVNDEKYRDLNDLMSFKNEIDNFLSNGKDLKEIYKEVVQTRENDNNDEHLPVVLDKSNTKVPLLVDDGFSSEKNNGNAYREYRGDGLVQEEDLKPYFLRAIIPPLKSTVNSQRGSIGEGDYVTESERILKELLVHAVYNTDNVAKGVLPLIKETPGVKDKFQELKRCIKEGNFEAAKQILDSVSVENLNANDENSLRLKHYLVRGMTERGDPLISRQHNLNPDLAYKIRSSIGVRYTPSDKTKEEIRSLLDHVYRISKEEIEENHSKVDVDENEIEDLSKYTPEEVVREINDKTKELEKSGRSYFENNNVDNSDTQDNSKKTRRLFYTLTALGVAGIIGLALPTTLSKCSKEVYVGSNSTNTTQSVNASKKGNKPRFVIPDNDTSKKYSKGNETKKDIYTDIIDEGNVTVEESNITQKGNGTNATLFASDNATQKGNDAIINGNYTQEGNDTNAILFASEFSSYNVIQEDNNTIISGNFTQEGNGTIISDVTPKGDSAETNRAKINVPEEVQKGIIYNSDNGSLYLNTAVEKYLRNKSWELRCVNNGKTIFEERELKAEDSLKVPDSVVKKVNEIQSAYCEVISNGYRFSSWREFFGNRTNKIENAYRNVVRKFDKKQQKVKKVVGNLNGIYKNLKNGFTQEVNGTEPNDVNATSTYSIENSNKLKGNSGVVKDNKGDWNTQKPKDNNKGMMSGLSGFYKKIKECFSGLCSDGNGYYTQKPINN